MGVDHREPRINPPHRIDFLRRQFYAKFRAFYAAVEFITPNEKQGRNTAIMGFDFWYDLF